MNRKTLFVYEHLMNSILYLITWIVICRETDEHKPKHDDKEETFLHFLDVIFLFRSNAARCCDTRMHWRFSYLCVLCTVPGTVSSFFRHCFSHALCVSPLLVVLTGTKVKLQFQECHIITRNLCQGCILILNVKRPSLVPLFFEVRLALIWLFWLLFWIAYWLWAI